MGFRVPSENNYNNERRFYVYEWFTKDEGKIFYVGKGTGTRYNHILSEISDKYRGIYYKELQDNFGIDFRIIADNLTNLEAEIYEICWMHERTSQGEVLLQFVDMPINMDEHNEMLKMYETRSFTPTIEISDYRKRYFGITESPNYDTINPDALLKTHFLSTGWMVSPYVSDETEEIKKYVKSLGGTVYATLAKSAKSVIEFGNLEYDRYYDLNEKGYEIYHSFHVLDYIKKSPVPASAAMPKKKIKPPKFDVAQRDEMRKYLKSIDPEIEKIIAASKDGYVPEIKGLDYKQGKIYKEAIKYLEASVRMGFDAPAAYLHLAIIYRKFGMFEEELSTLKKALKAVSPKNTSIREIKDRISKIKEFS
ncbi:hypothetical protein ACHOLT_14170 [Desulfitobacterium sp. Sab5]|uniref:hypothetical protein n=1 Tax=Desulfitobacterium nosdiversum TaxID=3375356 RepID=UPI003CE94BB1